MPLPATIVKVAAKLPWKQMLEYLPEVTSRAKVIWESWKARPTPAPIDPTAPVEAQLSALVEKVQMLEGNEKRQSEVMSQLAVQLEVLAGGLKETAARQRMILWVSMGSIVLAACALVVAAVA